MNWLGGGIPTVIVQEYREFLSLSFPQSVLPHWGEGPGPGLDWEVCGVLFLFCPQFLGAHLCDWRAGSEIWVWAFR